MGTGKHGHSNAEQDQGSGITVTATSRFLLIRDCYLICGGRVPCALVFHYDLKE